jgi:hypothetical protein
MAKPNPKSYNTNNSVATVTETAISSEVINHTTQENKVKGGVMKMKFLIIIAFLCLVVFTVACKNDEPDDKNTTWVQKIYPLAGTTWQLSKVIHTKTGVEKPIFVGDDVCTPFVPILDFETDTTGTIYIRDDSMYQSYPFNLSNDMWYEKFTMEGLGSNIANFLFASNYKEKWMSDYNFYFGHIGYRLEDGTLKLYQNDDGFFTFYPENGRKDMFNCATYDDETGRWIFYDISDTNWYNCVVWEAIR